jgi:hypothetical protein
VEGKETALTILMKEIRRKQDTYIGAKRKIGIGYLKRRYLLKQMAGKDSGIL